MNAALTMALPLEEVETQPQRGPRLLDESTGFLGLGRSFSFPLPQYVDDDPYRTIFFDEGVGRTLVFVHGLGANATHWEPLLRELAPRCRVVGLDLVGLGWTAKPNVDYTIDFLRDHLLDFLDRRGITKATIIGHSMGGAVSLATALARPGLVESLVLIDAAGVAPLPSWMQSAAPLTLNRAVLFPILGLGATFILKNVFVDSPEENPHVRWFHESALRDDPACNNLFDFARVCETLCTDVLSRDFSDRFETFNAPVLAIWGEADKLTTVGPVLKRLGRFPRLRTVMMPKTGHMPMIERPEETLFHIERFLTDPPR